MIRARLLPHLLVLLVATAVRGEAAESRSEESGFKRPVSGGVRADANETGDGLEMQVLTGVFSKKERALLDLQASTTELLEGESALYWNGIQIEGGVGEWKDGAYQYSIGVASARMRLPLVRVPVGPIQIGVDAGILAEADAHAQLTPELGYPLEMLSLHGKVGAKVTAAAFVEGYAKFVVVRGGVGGELGLIEGSAALEGRVYAKGRAPELRASGRLKFLQGKLYAFLDYFNLLSFRWKRVLQPTLKQWPGRCVDFGKEGSERCAASVPSPSSPQLD